MQNLSDQQKKKLTELGHSWKSDGFNELPVFYIENQTIKCNCSNQILTAEAGSINAHNHEDHCILRNRFQVAEYETKIS